MIYKFLHFFYKEVGIIFCRFNMFFWEVRDMLYPPQENCVLFIAHPDDDALFFHTFIKKYKPYVVLLTTGWSLRRFPDFVKAMRYYGVRFRAFDMETNDERVLLLTSRIQKVIRRGNFKLIATHNSSGEYGHSMHIKVNNAVVAITNEDKVITPVNAQTINSCPLSEVDIKEKEWIFNNIYKTERWALEEMHDWIVNERLI